MSLKLFGWLLIVSSIVPLALLIHQTRSRVPLRTLRDVDTSKVSFAKIGSLLGRLKRNDGTAGTLKVAAAVFLVVAGLGAARSYLGQPPEVIASEGAVADPLAPDEPDGDLAHLASYARSIAGEEESAPATTPETADGKLLPDVNTMIERLATRLASAPDDVQGWRMLGWSYVNIGRYDDATRAYAKAVALDPNSPEIARLYEEAKAKASEGDPSQAATPLQTGSVGAAGDTPHGSAIATSEAKSEAAPPHETDAAIRSMVDGLADRLERSPRDVDGWTRLMRSRVVLGEKEVATAAFRKALEVFKDDSAASSQIAAMAIELGLKSE